MLEPDELERLVREPPEENIITMHITAIIIRTSQPVVDVVGFRLPQCGHTLAVDLVLFDLGISVFHYEESNRGFSLRKQEELDMRLNESEGLTARDVVNTYPEQKLADVIFRYGEERYSRRIAAAICEERRKHSIETTDALADVVYRAVPQEYRHLRFHPATKTFQAIRIEVNGELDRIERALEGAMNALRPGGRIAVITFHSLEDRPVKWFFRNHTDKLEILTKKPIVPTEQECKENPPSRSAKLRVIERKAAYDD